MHTSANATTSTQTRRRNKTFLKGTWEAGSKQALRALHGKQRPKRSLLSLSLLYPGAHVTHVLAVLSKHVAHVGSHTAAQRIHHRNMTVSVTTSSENFKILLTR